MNLSYKDVQLIVEALDYRIKYYQELLENEAIDDEDKISDVSNDYYFLGNLRQDLAECLHKENLPQVKP